MHAAACKQLLGELGAACEPFARPLQRIQQELARAVFSGYYASEDGSLALRQLPYFAVVSRLETEKANLIADRDAARDALHAKEVLLYRASACGNGALIYTRTTYNYLHANTEVLHAIVSS